MGMGMNVRQLCTGNQERRVKWNHDINQDIQADRLCWWAAYSTRVHVGMNE